MNDQAQNNNNQTSNSSANECPEYRFHFLGREDTYVSFQHVHDHSLVLIMYFAHGHNVGISGYDKTGLRHDNNREKPFEKIIGPIPNWLAISQQIEDESCFPEGFIQAIYEADPRLFNFFISLANDLVAYAKLWWLPPCKDFYVDPKYTIIAKHSVNIWYFGDFSKNNCQPREQGFHFWWPDRIPEKLKPSEPYDWTKFRLGKDGQPMPKEKPEEPAKKRAKK